MYMDGARISYMDFHGLATTTGTMPRGLITTTGTMLEESRRVFIRKYRGLITTTGIMLEELRRVFIFGHLP